jgi:DNA polymerase III subunit alpha
VAYALGITDLDPIRHKLIFERFRNPDRVSMPDIDLDFDERRRGEMIRYVTQKYGEDRFPGIAQPYRHRRCAAQYRAGRQTAIAPGHSGTRRCEDL